MPYIGRSTDGFGVRNRFLYLASADDTSVSGADANGATLTFTDGAYVDVYLNGVLLKAGTDYNTNTANTIASLSAMAANDEVTVIVYDVFTVGDMVSATSGGTFVGAVTFGSTVSGLDVNGTEIILDADGDTSITADTDDRIDIKAANTDIVHILSTGMGIGTNNPAHTLELKTSAPEIMLEETSSGGSKRLSMGVTSGGVPFINAEQSGGVIAMNMTGTEVARFNSNGLSFPSGKGIDFSATADGTSTSRAEILDDYEEGVWTPTLENGGSVSVSNARYTKIGQQVYAGAYITVSSIPNNSDGFDIGNLPFTVADGSAYHGGGSVTYSGSFNWNNTGAIGAATPYATYPRLYFHRGDGSSATVKNNAVQGLQYFIFSTVYITNA